MGQIQRKKPYKAQNPHRTINEIRSILEKCGLFTLEEYRLHRLPDVACCRVILGDQRVIDLNIGTNGKGMIPVYSLASAYGEWMERIENSVLFPVRQMKFAIRRAASDEGMERFHQFLKLEGAQLDFHYGTDEKYLKSEELLACCGDILAQTFSASKENLAIFLGDALKGMEIPCVPYYSVFEKKVRLLPIKIIWNLCGTNGMSAGNTPREALIQGISEVLERYAIRCLYQERLTPPDIPAEMFKDTEIYGKLTRLEKEGWKVTVKDCSLGKGFPVIGLLVERPDGKYAFHLGADPSPVTALERCLTELFQGEPENNEHRYHRRERRDEQKDEKFWQRQFYETVECGFGMWPESIFEKEASYGFTGFPETAGCSDENDFKEITSVIRRAGYQMFVRDVSFLGFPAYQVYIPGMSETDFIFDSSHDDFKVWMKLVQRHRVMLNLSGASLQERAELAQAVLDAEQKDMPIAFDAYRWVPSNVSRTSWTLNGDYVLAVIYSAGGLYREAARSMRNYLDSEEASRGRRLYNKALAECWERRADGESLHEIKAVLSEKYNERLAIKICEMEGKNELPDEKDYPTCFDCEKCGIAQDCRYLDILKIVKVIQRQYMDHMPNQEALRFLWQEDDE